MGLQIYTIIYGLAYSENCDSTCSPMDPGEKLILSNVDIWPGLNEGIKAT
jgi:hypothetical protein